MARAGIALKFLQWFIRGVQFCCSALILAIYCYFLATLANHNLNIDNHLRAVTGISGLGVIYTIIGLVLVCCLAGLAFTSFIAIFLDICFAAAFIYVAWVNRNGASSCNGYLDTPYGRGNARTTVADGSDGFTHLPSFRSACRMQTACFAVAIVAIFFFLFSIGAEILLVRNRRKERRFGPSPKNNYTSGSGRKAGLFSWRRKKHAGAAGHQDPDNRLPAHTTPTQVRNSYNTEATAVGHHPDPAYANGAHNNKYGESGYAPTDTTGAHHGYHANTHADTPYGYDNGVTNGAANPYNGGFVQQGAPQELGHSYNDGVYDRR